MNGEREREREREREIERDWESITVFVLGIPNHASPGQGNPT